MSTEQTLAKDINRLRKESSYKEFEEGYFSNVPDLAGYIYKFKVEGAGNGVILIVNTSNSDYGKEYYHKDGWHFLIYKSESLKNFIGQIYEKISEIIDRVNNILDKEQQNADTRAGGVPHGYKLDANGELVVDPQEATVVRKIFKMYAKDNMNIRQIAAALKSNFSHVRDVLHDYRYEDMQLPIISKSLLKKTRQKLDINRKNRTT